MTAALFRTAAALLAAVTVLLLVYLYAMRRSVPPLPPGGVLMTAETTRAGGVLGVEHEERLRCPRQARARLVAGSSGTRRLMYRDGTEWVVATGHDLAIVPVPGGGRTVYFLRGARAPVCTGAASGGEPGVIPGFTAHPASAVAKCPAPGDVRRFERLEDAVATAGQVPSLLLFNGPHDPAYYVVRIAAEGSGAIVSAAGLPGTVYVRS